MKTPDINTEPSVSPLEVINMFKEALEKPGWMDDDKVADQFPRAANKNTSRMPPSEMDSGESRENVKQGKKRGLSKSLGIDLEGLPAKRQRG